MQHAIRLTVVVLVLSASIRPGALGAEEARSAEQAHPAQSTEAANSARGSTRPLDPVVAEIIDTPLTDADYADSVYCVDGRMLDSVEIIDSSRLLFHGRRGRVWLNQLRTPCFGLMPGRLLQFKLQGSRYCNLDSFRALDSAGPVRGQSSGICVLNTFEPVSEMQAGLIRESTDRYRRAGVRPRDDVANAEGAANAPPSGAKREAQPNAAKPGGAESGGQRRAAGSDGET